MVSKTYHLHNGRRGSALAVHIIAYSDSNKIVNITPDGTLEVSLKVSFGEKESNSGLIQYLSKILGASKEKIEVVAGQTGRHKLVSVLDIDPAVVQEKINQNKK